MKRFNTGINDPIVRLGKKKMCNHIFSLCWLHMPMYNFYGVQRQLRKISYWVFETIVVHPNDELFAWFRPTLFGHLTVVSVKSLSTNYEKKVQVNFLGSISRRWTI